MAVTNNEVGPMAPGRFCDRKYDAEADMYRGR